jgi:DNA-binding CsgD family transcriptional regulator
LCNRYEEAVEGFQRVADGTDSRKLAVAALQAAGVVHSDAGDAEKALACLVEAYERFPEECDHPLALLNLAGAASMVGQWEAVLKWSDLAEEAMKRESAGSKASEVDPQWQALIQGSRLLAFMKLGRTAEADAVFLHMPLRDLKVVGAVGVLSNYTSYALQQDAFAHFVGHLPELQAIALLDSSATVRQMGAYATLFEPWRSDVWGELPLEDVWAQVRAMPANLGDQARIGAEREPKGVEGAASGTVFLPGTAADRWKIAAAGLFLLAVGGMVQAWQLWRARRRAQGWSTEREAELMASLRNRIAGLRGAQSQAGARWLLMEVLRRRGLSRLLSLGEGMRNLTRREQEFIIHLAAGLRTKEFARIHRLSASYVYNLSHSIRRKLHVPEAVELPDWIAAHQRKGE